MPLSQDLDLKRIQIYKWTYPKYRGGTDGLIPSRHQKKIIECAKRRGVAMPPNDFFDYQAIEGENHD